MASRKSRTRQSRRDRRKAKESGWIREGTVNARRVGHHLSVGHGTGPRRFKIKGKPGARFQVVLDHGPAVTNLGALLRDAAIVTRED